MAHPTFSTLTGKEIRDLRVLVQFTSVYCGDHHAAPDSADPPYAEELGFNPGRFPVCAECRDFLTYAFERRVRCPLDPKPTCKECTIHCYRKGHRERVREIMRYSGKKLILRGRLDLLWHYFF